ncbi:MAG: dodecin domain-containing protein [Peptostreptococcaceae bacterium]|nr:dodecin domain-containing protein [Peptostreptococcaceae bacterium]
MAILKVVELLSESETSWEAAAQEAVKVAAKTVDNIKSVNIGNFQAIVEDNKVVKYRVNAKVSFIVHD